jgi:hypothetical protein
MGRMTILWRPQNTKALQLLAKGPSVNNDANYAEIALEGLDPHSP